MRTSKESIIPAGQYSLSKNEREALKTVRVTTALVIAVYHPKSSLGAMYHVPLPDSHVSFGMQSEETKLNYVDTGLPVFIDELNKRQIPPGEALVKLIGGAQLFNFSGGSGNILNIGTRNIITARTILTREGFSIEKAETGGNKPRTITLELEDGSLWITLPGQPPKQI